MKNALLFLALFAAGCATYPGPSPDYHYGEHPVERRAVTKEKEFCKRYGWCGQHLSGEIIRVYDQSGREILTVVED